MTKFVAGQYTATYNGKNLGQTAEGFRLSHQFFKRLITGDLGAQTPQDAVYQGREQFVSFRLIEADEAGVNDCANPYGGSFDDPTVGVIGSFDTQSSSGGGSSGGSALASAAKPLVLTALTGTSAANFVPSMTFSKAILAEGFPVEFLLGPDLLEVPIRMRCYPNMENNGTFSA
jgi:hypothetical protein